MSVSGQYVDKIIQCSSFVNFFMYCISDVNDKLTKFAALRNFNSNGPIGYTPTVGLLDKLKKSGSVSMVKLMASNFHTLLTVLGPFRISSYVRIDEMIGSVCRIHSFIHMRQPFVNVSLLGLGAKLPPGPAFELWV